MSKTSPSSASFVQLALGAGQTHPLVKHAPKALGALQRLANVWIAKGVGTVQWGRMVVQFVMLVSGATSELANVLHARLVPRSKRLTALVSIALLEHGVLEVPRLAALARWDDGA